MSTYYMFYAGKRNKETGAVDVIGPYYKDKNGEFKVECLYCRSKSFIHWEDFEEKAIGINVSIASADLQKLVGYDKADKGARAGWNYLLCEWLPMSEVWVDPNDIVIRGYLTHNEMEMLIRTDYSPDVIEYELSGVLPAEVYAEMSAEDRAEYGHVGYINRNSVEYICNVLSEAVSEISEFAVLNENEEFGLIMVIG